MTKLQSPAVRWPAEWEPQAATWISWPHNRRTWPGHFDPVPSTFVNFIRELSRVQRVEVLAGPAGVTPAACELLGELSNVRIHSVPTDDVWIRDFGPTFVRRLSDGSLVGVDWHFNAWGGKYPPYDSDATAAVAICDIVGCTRQESWLTCEGGALETDGLGTLMTTSSVLLSGTRNPNRSRQEIEGELRQQLGVEQIIWVDGGGIDGDDTDGHIDQLARFVAPGTVVAAVSSSSEDNNHDGLAENLRVLQQSHAASGERLNVVPLPTPLPRFVDDRRVPESYCNFLIANEIVIVPTFRSPKTDAQALKLLEQLMPDRRMVPVDAFDLIWGLGAFHCASQHMPVLQA